MGAGERAPTSPQIPRVLFSRSLSNFAPSLLSESLEQTKTKLLKAIPFELFGGEFCPRKCCARKNVGTTWRNSTSLRILSVCPQEIQPQDKCKKLGRWTWPVFVKRRAVRNGLGWFSVAFLPQDTDSLVPIRFWLG